MNFGIYLSNYGEAVSPRQLAGYAGAAEQYGWDGFFLWDQMLVSKNSSLHIVDPWVSLAAMAMTTTRLRLGTTVTPLARRRPWKLARETVTLDQLSGGRLILSVGVGEPAGADFELFGEPGDLRTRAEKLDEGLAILDGLWRGKRFSFEGRHYRLGPVTFRPTPVQQPRIPIWVGGYWPRQAPFRRAARWDGAFPLKTGGGGIQPKDIRDLRAFIQAHRVPEARDKPFDLAVLGKTDPADPRKGRKKVISFFEAGATWWMENFFIKRDDPDKILERIRQGPPR
jgi:alkanesulfonate monooxygenase SsuD/methylene tetrahydromethanopterin reductase-like flavin-dependent oxidoreductase (luciferase family)